MTKLINKWAKKTLPLHPVAYSTKEALAFAEGAKWSLDLVAENIGGGGAGRALAMARWPVDGLINEIEKSALNQKEYDKK
jgi:hypothetical protein